MRDFKSKLLIVILGVLLTLSFSVSAQSLPTVTMDKPVKDMTISELQAKIAEILSVIQQLQALIAQLLGEVDISGIPGAYTFNTNLSYGASSIEVKYLQIFLNQDPDTRVSSTGYGSLGNETTYYGTKTKQAVIKFQEKYASEVLSPWNISKGTGYVGTSTRQKMNQVLQQYRAGQAPSPTPPLSGTYCGDNIAQRPNDQLIIEDCDGTDIRNKTCISQGYTGGTLSCSNDCSFNVSLCTGTGPTPTPTPTPTPGPSTSCGDSIIQKPNSEGIYEVCDSTNLGNSTCLSYSYIGGTLSCSSNCITFNTLSCITESGGGGGGGGGEPEPEPDPGPVCGNNTDNICPSGCTNAQDDDCTYCGDNILQKPNNEGISEVCDGTSLSGETCITKGFPGGTLQCSNTCLTFDTSTCISPEPENQAPVLNTIGNKTINENSLLSFTISATDPDADELSYSISDRPSGAEFNASSRTFTWTPLYNQSGTYNVTFTVSDGSLTDTETITITVSNVNRAPILNPIGDKTTNENQELSFTISGSDLDEDTLYYSIIDSPSGASFNSSTRTFTWTPSYTQSGTYTPTFIVSDSEYTDQETITITVNDICVPDTCFTLGYECETWGDGCGGTLNCGTCSSGYVCESGLCVVETPEPYCGDSICNGTETCSSCSADCGDCAPSFPTDYISYWKFDENATDSGPGNNDGALMGDAQIVSDAERGNVLSLDGVDDYVEMGTVLVDQEPFTITAWMYVEDGGGDGIIVSKMNAGGDTGFWEFLYNDVGASNNRLRFLHDTDGATNVEAISNDNVFNQNEWEFVAVTWDGTTEADGIIFYVDGSEVSGYTTRRDGTGSIITDAANQLEIGARALGTDRLFNGFFDDVMFFNRSLTPTEIQEIMNIGTECTVFGDCSPRECYNLIDCDPGGTGYDYLDPMGCGYNYNDGASCDSLYCKIGQTCLSGACQGGSDRDCSDIPVDIACTDDSCDEVLDTCENVANNSNCIAGYICDALLDCIIDPCDGIDFCSNYTDSVSCDDNTCGVSGPGCEWNVSVCEEWDTSLWTPPIGIPYPEFGIYETYRMYDDPANRNPALTYTQNAEGGYYTHYVDFTDPNCDDGNAGGYGDASNPRCSIPMYSDYLPAGSVVEVHGKIAIRGSYGGIVGWGTVDQPIFIRGIPGDPPYLHWKLIFLEGSYMILENIAHTKVGVRGESLAPNRDSHHIAVRNNELYSTYMGPAGITVGDEDLTAPRADHIVFYNNHIHDAGDLTTWDDQDCYGASVGNQCTDVWIVDNEIHETSGGGVLVSGGGKTYVGRNHIYRTRQCGVAAKGGENLIFSENTIHDVISWGTHRASGMGFQYGPDNIWFLFNEVYNVEQGFATGHTTQWDPEINAYLIGNVIHDLHFYPEFLVEHGPILMLQSELYAISWRASSHAHSYIIGNTIYNTPRGVGGGPGSHEFIVVDNIIANIASVLTGGSQVFVGNPDVAAASVLENNLFYQPGGELRIQWGNQFYTDLDDFRQATGTGAGCIVGDPQFVDAANGDFNLLSTSPAIDSGKLSDVYATFEQKYGIDIRKDIENRVRPQGAEWDIGAYESGASPARISQTDEELNNLASVLSSIQSAVQDILKRIQELF